LKLHARRCRRIARTCKNDAVARVVAEMTERFELEALSLIARVGLSARLAFED